MIRLNGIEDCCGCTACAHVCRHGAVRLRRDSYGYVYADFDSRNCVECGECDKVCDFNTHKAAEPADSPVAYALRLKNPDDMSRSQSGGAFVALSDSVIRQGGAVYGAGYDTDLNVIHKRTATAAGRDEFRGSKYVQSDISRIYSSVREDLRGGKPVMFSGTPCQVGALRRYIGSDLGKRLILVDLICHGVTAPGLWTDYRKYLEKRHHSKMTHARFRDKKFGWHAQRESFTFADGRTVYPDFLLYHTMFFRESCNRCPYSGLNRTGDITIGDYWGVEKALPGFADDNKGCSLVICNTRKGRDLFNAVKDCVDCIPVERPSDYLQPNLERPTLKHREHDRFRKLYDSRGFEYAMSRFGFIGWRLFLRRTMRKIKRVMKKL